MGRLRNLRSRWREVRSRHEDDLGASLVEYALLLALIAVVCILAITFLGGSASSKYSTFGTCWEWAGSGGGAPAECQ